MSSISDHTGEEERIYSGGKDNKLLIVDIESQANNKEREYECILFINYLRPFNWFIKVTSGWANSRRYNISGVLSRDSRILLYRICSNYLYKRNYVIPDYITKLFSYHCKERTGSGDYDDPEYVSFNYINSDSSMFSKFREFWFYDDEDKNKVISPNKVNKMFINCKIFTDQDNKRWIYENNKWVQREKE